MLTQAHDDRNLARKLTPAEKKEKKHQRLVGQATETDAPTVNVYRVRSLADPRHRFKVRVNADVSLQPVLTINAITAFSKLHQEAVITTCSRFAASAQAQHSRVWAQV